MRPLRLAAFVAAATVLVTAAPGAAFPGAPTPLTASAPGGPTAVPDEPGQGPAAVRRVFPVRGETSYGTAHHDYPATDIFAACGSRVVAPVAGEVLEVSRTDRWDPSTNRPAVRGGKSFSIAGIDGVRYYGSHLRSLAGWVRPGAPVRAGQPLGRVGQTGNAAYTSCHLHFGIGPLCRARDDWWIRRGVIRPYRFLRSWAAGRRLGPEHAVARWSRHHGCKISDIFG
ncbi:MAG TPA: M23 family metallopeptidase [Nocardioidaceae bacterium]|nr:M23 family metallopeptidase [Nocardioidaceae bacterium]